MLIDEKKLTSAVKGLVFLGFLITYLLVFVPNTDEIGIVLALLPVISITVLFGFIPLVSFSQIYRKWYDPATLFNAALLYYCIKGVSIGTNINEPFLLAFTPINIKGALIEIIFFITTAVLLWNVTYLQALRWATNNSKTTKPSKPSKKSLTVAVIVLSMIGIGSSIVLFRSLNISPLYFIENPLARSYLTTDLIGANSPLANLWKMGISFFWIGSLVWLVNIGTSNKKMNLFWILHAITGIILVILTGGRMEVIGTTVSIFVIYHMFINPIRISYLGIISFLGISYAYFIREWRSISWSTDILSGFGIIASNLSIPKLIDFIGGVDLSDIRTMILIRNVYGEILPLKFGTTYLRLFTQLIPRALWHDKPLDLGLEIASLYLGENTIVGMPPGLFGELYMNFHYVGIILGAVILGILFAKLYVRWISRKGIEGNLYYALAVPTILSLPSSTFANVVLIFIIKMAILCYILQFSKKIARSEVSSVKLVQLDQRIIEDR